MRLQSLFDRYIDRETDYANWEAMLEATNREYAGQREKIECKVSKLAVNKILSAISGQDFLESRSLSYLMCSKIHVANLLIFDHSSISTFFNRLV
ncbi:hypothetical protein PVOR_08630 [Paenibacillus vortex V453]|uniref:Uncharacterized protein n=1 Tax=Paenibacillus vortex V453 TaxID=715225 RepID=A0A2R9SY66_9BACL|nr:hypothetical protein PVOR_08630 [Paenibacillus vortex V453]